MAGGGYGKDVRKQMSTYNTANPNATAEQKMGQRQTALTAAQNAMSQPGAPQSSRITNRLNRVNKRMPASPSPAPTPSPSPLPTAGKLGGPLPATKPPVSGIAPGEENRLPKTGTPAPSTSAVKKKRQPVTINQM